MKDRRRNAAGSAPGSRRLSLSLATCLILIPLHSSAFVIPLAAQDPTGHWRTLETAHFNVHVREDYRDVGVRAAGEAEQAWRELAAILPPPERRIELVIADNVDDANGFATTYPLPHIVVYAMPPAGDLQLDTYDRWLRLVIVHELTHVFHLDAARGLWHVARTVFGRAPILFPNTYTPPWMREGLAVFYESRVTGAGRLGDAFHRALVRAASEEQGGLQLDAANTPTALWPGGIRAYAFGSNLMEYTAAQHGDSAIARFVSRLATLPLPYLQLGTAWRQATGAGLGGTWRAAQGSPRGSPDSSVAPVTVFDSLRVLLAPRLSADGRRIALVHNDGRDVSRLMVANRDGKRLPGGGLQWARISRVDQATAAAFLPGGGLLVSQLEQTDPYTIRSDLWRIDTDGHASRLTRGMRLREADVAPDGAIVAVRVVPGGNELVLIPSTAGGMVAEADVRVIGPRSAGVEYATPRFDGSGQRIAVVRVEGGWHDIVVLGRDGGLIRQVTRDSVIDLHPAFTPEGGAIVWSREVAGVPQIVALDLATGTARVLTREPYAAWAPAPLGGDSLLYFSYHADGFRLVAAAMRDEEALALEAAAAPPAVDTAPVAVIVREHAYHAFPSVLPQYWIPQLFVEVGGARFGALSSGTDALGRHEWSASLMAGIGSLGGQVDADAGYAWTGVRNLVFDVSVSHSPELYLTQPPGTIGVLPTVVTCCVANDAAHAGVTFGRHRLRTVGTVRVGLELTDEHFVSRRGANLTASLSHLAGAALAISPQDGWRVQANVRYRERTTGSLTNTQLVLRGSAFSSSRSRSFARQVFGARVAWGMQAGDDPVNFSVGGVSSTAIEVIPGVALGGSSRVFQVRGYPPGTLSARRVLGLSLENRVPLALVDRGLGMLPLGLDKVSASLFTDAGFAWDDSYCPGFGTGTIIHSDCNAWIWSVGAELAADLGLGYEVPLRVRAGAALRIRESGHAGAWVALGSSF